MRRAVFNAAMLLATGGISALAIALITAGQIDSISPATGSAIASLVVWQTLSVTVAKMGLDAYLLPASAHLQTGEIHAFPKNYFRRATFAACAVGALAYLADGLDWSASVAVTASTLLDVPAIVRTAECTALGRMHDVIIGNLLRFPLFLLLLLGASTWTTTVDPGIAMASFVISAAARFVWIRHCVRDLRPIAPVNATVTATLAQQIANLVMFRGDQMVAPLFFVSPGQLAHFFFLSKFAEMVSMAAATAGGTLFPAATNRWAQASPIRRILEGAGATLAIGIVCLPALTLYGSVWSGGPITWQALALSGVAAVLSWPANFLSYRLMRDGKIGRVITACLIAIAVGAVVIAAAVRSDSGLEAFLCALPLALFSFTVACLTGSVRR
jgi:hypothetical protein